jgi:hypothetical protein
VGDVYYTRQPTPGGVGEREVLIDPRNGLVRLTTGAALQADYLLADGSITPDGEVVARDDLLGTTLWRIGGEVVSTTSISGLYPNDTWSRENVRWTRRRCRGGELVVSLSSDPSLFDSPQTVTARPPGGEPVRARLEANEQTELRVPLPDRLETCVVEFQVSPTAVPAELNADSNDHRVLGAHFNAFDYRPEPT